MKCTINRAVYLVSLYTRFVGMCSLGESGNEGDVQNCQGFASLRLFGIPVRDVTKSPLR